MGSTCDSAAVNIRAMSFLRLWGRSMISMPCFSHICHRVGSNLEDSPERGVCIIRYYLQSIYHT